MIPADKAQDMRGSDMRIHQEISTACLQGRAVPVPPTGLSLAQSRGKMSPLLHRLKASLKAGCLITAVAVSSNSAAAAQSADPEQQQAPASDDDQPEGTIIVTGRAQQLYRVQEVLVGKLSTTPLESSQMVTTITNQLIEDQGARDAQDLYRNISGVSFYSFAGVAARGFRQEEIFYDGLRGDPNAGFAVPQLFNVERVEFLKGPAGMLYGPGAPGGLFNYVTKKPTDQSEAEVRIIGGTAGRYGGLAEANGSLGGGFSARGGLFYEDRGLLRFNASQETLIADGGLAYNTGDTRIIFQATRYDQKQNAARLRGVPVNDEGRFLTSRRWNANEPDDFLKMKSDVLQGRIEAKPFANVVLDATVRYNDGEEEQRYHELNALLDTNNDGTIDAVRREYRVQQREQESWSYGANAVWSAEISGTVKNRVLLGFDRYTITESRVASRLRGNTRPTPGLPSPISLFDPVYQPGVSATYIDGPQTTNAIESKREGFYALDELSLGPVILTAGIRYDSYRDDVNGEVFSGDNWSYRFGAVYRLNEEISVFGQYATTFEPQSPGSQTPLTGGPFDPTSGDIFEGGFKTALFNGRVQTAGAVYRIRRTNVLQNDPRGDVGGDGVDDLIAAGEVVSKGFEFDLATDITPNWVVTANYAYNDTRITEGFVSGAGDIGDSVGDRFANAPKHTLGFWTRYQLPKLGLAAAIGGDYVSRRLSVDGQTVRPYMIFDGSLIYEKGPIRAMFRVENILDKTYAASGFLVRSGHYPGRPRSAFVELRYLFL